MSYTGLVSKIAKAFDLTVEYDSFPDAVYGRIWNIYVNYAAGDRSLVCTARMYGDGCWSSQRIGLCSDRISKEDAAKRFVSGLISYCEIDDEGCRPWFVDADEKPVMEIPASVEELALKLAVRYGV